MESMAGVVLGVGLLVISGVVHLVRSEADRDGLRRNTAVGIRTRSTLTSEAAWRAGHRAASPWLRAAATAGWTTAAAGATSAVLVTITGTRTIGPVVICLVGYVAVLTIVVLGVRRADAAARSVDER